MEWVSKALQNKVELSFDDPNQPVWIKGDALLLKELLANLIDNAISYGQVKGNIIVRLVSDEQPCLLVEDDGIGIPLTEQARIFERFLSYSGELGRWLWFGCCKRGR